MISDTEDKLKAGQSKKIIFADTDTMSSFLKRDAIMYFIRILQDQGYEIVVPDIVFEELTANRNLKPRFEKTIESCKRQGYLKIEGFDMGSPEFIDYIRYTREYFLGDGESAALSMVKHCRSEAALASNNLSDVLEHVKSMNVELWTTGRILLAGIETGRISEQYANTLWQKMIKDGLKLPYPTFTEYMGAKKLAPNQIY